VGVAGDGYGLSLKARFPKCPEGLQCRWVFALASREDGEPKSTKLWRYTIEAETINGVTTVEAFGRRESGFGGDDLPKLIVKATEGSVVPDEWHSLALAVNRVKRVMTFWVDGIGQGSAGFDDETFDHIDRLGVFAQAEVPLEVTTQPDVPGLGDESWLPATVYVDDVRLYAFSAAQLDELWQ